MEATTSRPLLLSGIARLTRHAGQSRLLLTLNHVAEDQIKTMTANIRKGCLDCVWATAPQLPKEDRWRTLLRYIVEKIITAKTEIPLPPSLPPPNMAIGMG